MNNYKKGDLEKLVKVINSKGGKACAKRNSIYLIHTCFNNFEKDESTVCSTLFAELKEIDSKLYLYNWDKDDYFEITLDTLNKLVEIAIPKCSKVSIM